MMRQSSRLMREDGHGETCGEMKDLGIVAEGHIGGHGDVGEDAEAFAVVVEGVMRAPGNVPAEEVFAAANCMRRCDCPSHRRQSSLYTRWAPWKPDVAVFTFCEHVAQEALDVFWTVCCS